MLAALGVGFSPTLALVVLCLAAAAALLPIASGGAIANVSATAAVLLALGVHKEQAINFGMASGLLLCGSAAAAAVIGVATSVVCGRRARTLTRATASSRLSGERVVAHDDPLALDADDGAPRNRAVRVVAADPEMLEPRAVPDAEAGHAEAGRGHLAAEVAAASEFLAGLGDDLALHQRRQRPHRPAPGILST